MSYFAILPRGFLDICIIAEATVAQTLNWSRRKVSSGCDTFTEKTTMRVVLLLIIFEGKHICPVYRNAKASAMS